MGSVGLTADGNEKKGRSLFLILIALSDEYVQRKGSTRMVDPFLFYDAWVNGGAE